MWVGPSFGHIHAKNFNNTMLKFKNAGCRVMSFVQCTSPEPCADPERGTGSLDPPPLKKSQKYAGRPMIALL